MPPSLRATDVKVIAGYAASSALIKQIARGAAADVFASANLEWMDFGSKGKLLKDDTRINLLGNQLVLIAPKDSKLESVAIGPNLSWLHVEKRRLASSTLLMLMAPGTVAFAGSTALRISRSIARGQGRQPRSAPA